MTTLTKTITFPKPVQEHLSEVPKPPSYLSNMAKKHYKNMGEKLLELKRLKSIFLEALEIYAEAMAQFEWATREINAKNKDGYGTGYIQVYRSKATNISTELVLRNNAEQTLLKCFKQFGLDPRSEKELKATENPNQVNLFDDFLTKTS